LRIAQTSPFDVHRRLSHVLEMHSQIRASRFARFRRVVGLSGVLDHRVEKIRVLLFCGLAFSFYYLLGAVLPPFAEKKFPKQTPNPKLLTALLCVFKSREKM
jgi:hypothetical protein